MAKQSTSNLPEIRFKGFEGAWVEEILGSIASMYSGGTPTAGEDSYYGGNIPFIRSAEINSYKTALTISNEGLNTSSAKMVNEGDILYALYGATSGEVGISKINGAINQAILAIKPDPEYDPFFLEKWLRQKKSWIISTFLQGGQGNLSGAIIRNLTLNRPEIHEQTKIGNYFKELDRLIGLHQRKHDKLITLKKAMLQKMFPQDGATTPEIRLKGFSGNWSKKKLSHFVEVSTEKNFEGVFSKSDVLSVSGDVGVVNQIEFQGRSFAGKSVANYGVVRQGWIVYTKSPLKASPFGIIKTNQQFDGIVSTLYAVYTPKDLTDAVFVQYYFELGSRLSSYLRPLVNKGAKNDMKVSDENVLLGPVVFPRKEEQQKIAAYFINLDNLISKHASQLQKLKQIKSGCLEKMFV